MRRWMFVMAVSIAGLAVGALVSPAASALPLPEGQVLPPLPEEVTDLVPSMPGGIVIPPPPPDEGNWPATAGSHDRSYVTSFDGRTRTYRLHLPTGFDPEDGVVRPLVMILHGAVGQPSTIESSSDYSLKSDAENFIAVYPAGLGSVQGGTWNASQSCCGYSNKNGIDDVAFLRGLVGRLQAHYAIDTERVFAAGMSNGAVMTWRLACDASDIFAAFAPNAGDSTTLHPDLSACELARPISIVNLHGDADDSMPYDGGTGSGLERYVREPVEDPNPDLYDGQTDIGQWTGLLGCSFTPVAVETTADYVKKTFCDTSDVQIVNYKVLGGTHSWFRTEDDGISTTDVTWAFFIAHPSMETP